MLEHKRRENALEWEAGTVLELGKDGYMLFNAAQIGNSQAYKFVQELTLEQLQGEIEHATDQ